ncbi:MAG: carboxypeptidase-like regulatory domain-containing protein [Leeuwenhoekiella sp.]
MLRALLLALVFLQSIFLSAQGLTGTIVDGQGESIPFATVAYGKEKGVITNENGEFLIAVVPEDLIEITISAMGFETKTVARASISTAPITLTKKSINLNEVYVSNKNLTAEEIVERVMLRVDSNYVNAYRKKQFFIRETTSNAVRQFDIEVDKSTIKELNQALINKFLANVPKQSNSYTESLGDYYGKGAKASIDLHKVANLYNPAASSNLDELTTYLEQIIKEHVKSDSYYKIRSGIIGVKVDADDMGIEKDTVAPKPKTTEEIKQDSLDRLKRHHDAARYALLKANGKQFWREDLDFDVFQKPRKYEFIRNGYSIIDGEVAYRIEFVPKRSADFEGVMYVNTVDYGIYRLEYSNVRPLSKLRLFGISHKEDVSKGIYIYSKTDGKYQMSYCEIEIGETTGVNRPLTIIEKNKNVRGRRKQNELDMDVEVVISNIDKLQLVFMSDENFSEEEYEKLSLDENVTIKSFTKYDPEYWSDYTIIQPNDALKQFDISGRSGNSSE